MHIVLVSRLFGHGGIAVYNRTLARALVSKGHRVTIVTSRNSADVPEFQNDGGVHIYRLLAQNRYRLQHMPLVGCYMRPLHQYLYSRQVAHRLNELEAGAGPDIIEFAEVGGEGFAYLRQRRRRPAVVRCHTPTFVLHRYRLPKEIPGHTSLTGKLEKFCINHADALTAPSQDMARTIAESCNVQMDHIKVIPNLLEAASFSTNQSGELLQESLEHGSKRQATDEITILHVGRLDRAKGIEILTRAIPQVLQEVPQVIFIFIGDDRPDKVGSTWQKRLEAEVNRQYLTDRVRFLGLVDHSKLLHWYQQADIAVVPAIIYESFSYTCAQAMAAGVPVVASRIGGIPETVDDGINGILVGPGDSKELAGALVKLGKNPDLRHQMGQAGREKAHQYFDASIVADKMLQLYASVSQSHIATVS